MGKSEFTYLLRVRYGECDAQKVVFNARYGDYIDIAVTEFIRVVWDGIDKMLANDLDYQLVRQLIEWKSAARFDDVLAVRVQCVRVGTTSFTLRAEFTSWDDPREVAVAETVYVMVSATTLVKKAISAEYRARLHRGAPGIVVDHANSRR